MRTADGATGGPRSALNHHAAFILLATAYVIAGLWLLQHTAPNAIPAPGVYGNILINLTWRSLFFFALGHMLYVVLILRPAHPVPVLLGSWRRLFLNPRRWWMALPVLALMPLFFAVFSGVKSLIPLLHPFAWDRAFMLADARLHGGQPWRWLQPLLGYPPVTAALTFLYNYLWLALIYLAVVWQAFTLSQLRLRMRFFISFLLCWIILGSLAAFAFSSAGPCYYHFLAGGAHPFLPLLDYLDRTGELGYLTPRPLQEWLWNVYQARVGGAPAAGISAMPSMHVSMAVLLWLLGRQRGPWLGRVGAGYAAVVLIGSVALGWHYAVDSYAAVLGTVLIWRVVGALLRRDDGSAGARSDMPAGAAAP